MPKESEDELATCLQAKARWGYGSTQEEVREIVKEYVCMNKDSDTDLGRYLIKHNLFKNNMP